MMTVIQHDAGRESWYLLYALDAKGLVAAVSKMAFGNKHGREPFEDSLESEKKSLHLDLVTDVSCTGSYRMRKSAWRAVDFVQTYPVIGAVSDEPVTSRYGDVEITMDEALNAWTGTLEKVFPTSVI